MRRAQTPHQGAPTPRQDSPKDKRDKQEQEEQTRRGVQQGAPREEKVTLTTSYYLPHTSSTTPQSFGSANTHPQSPPLSTYADQP